MTVNISDLNKSDVLVALYNAAKPLGMGFMQYDPAPMSLEEAESLLKRSTYFDYLKGRVMKIDLSTNDLDEWDYDRDNGKGAVQSVINILRETKNANSTSIQKIHADNTFLSAVSAEGHLSEKDTVEQSTDGFVHLTLGLGEYESELRPILEKVKMANIQDPEESTVLATEQVAQQKLKTTHLIQRLMAPLSRPNPFAFGGGLRNGGLSDEAMALLQDIFSFDYMGAAEFEWGEVPDAFSSMRQHAEDKGLTSGVVEEVYYICPKVFEEDVKSLISNLRKTELPHLKEFCGLAAHFKTKSSKPRRNTLGWLELDNGFMFFVDEDMFNKVKVLYGLT